MPILNWIGKDKVINHNQQVPYRVLEPQYTYGQAGSDNMIIHGDNLDALKAFLSSSRELMCTLSAMPILNSVIYKRWALIGSVIC